MPKVQLPDCEIFTILDTYKDFVRSVVEIFHETPNAASDSVLLLDAQFSAIRTRVANRWGTHTRMFSHQLPYRDDAIKLLWMTYRKSTLPNRTKIVQWCKADVEAAA